MISWPLNDSQHAWGREFIFQRAGAVLQPDCHMLFWYSKDDPRPTWILAFHDWLGSTCQVTFANDKVRFFPRALFKAGFQYAFRVQRRKMLYATANSLNKPARKIQDWLGFKELYRGSGLHTDGGDIILLGMTPEQCTWLQKETHEERPASGT